MNRHSQKPIIQNNEMEYTQTYNIINEMSFSSKSPSSRNKGKASIQAAYPSPSNK